ncbi:MAG TPA: ATP-binding protein [Bryobacteraceae bacterium]|jgi:serine/threonine-protein kinase RsbW|nr:ATP-binding protein [Bryobacteraceae bacterium]
MDPAARRLTLPAHVESVAVFRDFVRSQAVAAEVPAEEFDKLDLVLEEILINIARYAYVPGTGEAEVVVASDGPGRLSVEIADWGNAFNPLDVEPPDFSRGLAERPIGGLGVFLIRSLVSSIDYRREADRNILSFVFPATDSGGPG